MGEAFITRRGGGQKWGKYNAIKTPIYTHTAYSQAGTDGAWDAYQTEIQVGTGYTFDKYNGYTLTGVTTKTVKNSNGYYRLSNLDSSTGVYRTVYTAGSAFLNGGYVWLNITIVGRCTVTSYEYPKGSTKYCSVISNEGTNQPERGTFVSGSADSNSCAIEVDGIPYYYEKE